MGNELIFEGKKYISAKRASQITGYNSDYIGQLCRKGSLECRLVGRSWFVEEKSLESHQIIASKTPRGRIPTKQKIASSKPEAIASTTSPIAETHIGVKLLPEPRRETVEISPESILAFRSHDHDLFLSEDDFDDADNQFFAKKIVLALIFIFVFIFATPFLMRGDRGAEVISAVNVGSEIAREISLQASTQIASTVSSMKDLNLFASLDSQKIHALRVKTHKLTLRSYHLVSVLPTMFFDTAKNMKTLVMREGEKIYDYATTNKSGEIDSMGEVIGDRPGEIGVRAGVTVVPSSGDASKDEKIKQYIRDSFSDETEVVPDESGTSGVIKPVFKKQSDQDYLYVIVPVKDD